MKQENYISIENWINSWKNTIPNFKKDTLKEVFRLKVFDIRRIKNNRSGEEIMYNVDRCSIIFKSDTDMFYFIKVLYSLVLNKNAAFSKYYYTAIRDSICMNALSISSISPNTSMQQLVPKRDVAKYVDVVSGTSKINRTFVIKRIH